MLYADCAFKTRFYILKTSAVVLLRKGICEYYIFEKQLWRVLEFCYILGLNRL